MRRGTTPVVSCLLCLGVKADLSDLAEVIVLPLKNPLECAGIRFGSLRLNNYAHYPEYAPPGCSSLTVILSSDTYRFWKQARGDGSYGTKKEAVAMEIIARLEESLPRLKGAVEVWDFATPLTYERYCGTFHGSWMTKRMPKRAAFSYPLRAKTVESLYFAGQRMQVPGGLPIAVTTGRRAAQFLCRDFGMVFG